MLKKILVWTLAAAAVIAAAAATLSSSLPRRDGTLSLPGLEAAVRIELDARAVPRIRAASLEDAYRAQGYLHAQERFFQMDLMRRSTAGELSALIGEATLPVDRAQRVFQLRRRANALKGALPDEQLGWFEAYVEGVNAGLEDLGSRPPEYWLLRSEPAPWTVEDSLLVVFAFYTMLSDNENYELSQGVLQATVPPSVYDFLTPSTSRFDRPLVSAAGGTSLTQSASDLTGGYLPKAIPPASDTGPRPRVLPPRRRPVVDPPLTGAASNQWAAGRARSASGEAMIANDPHLQIGLPNVFYRSELYWEGRVARGVGIPGVPGIIIGATDRLAWGVTVSYADQSDWVVVERDAADDGRYRVPEGTEPFVIEQERIAVRGREQPDLIDIPVTRWGPVVESDWLGRPLVLRATWLQPGGAGVDVLNLVTANTTQDGIDVLSDWAGPSLNWMLADRAGNLGWIVNGPLPRRVGFDGSVPGSWADGERRWDGLQELPSLIAPNGVMLTANNRTLPAEAAESLGRMWMRPLRAKRIADLLGEQRRFDEAGFLAMQLDTRVEGYDVVRDIALEVLDEKESDTRLAAVRESVLHWNGRADATQSAFRILHVYYRALLEQVLSPLLAPTLAAEPGFVYRWPLADEPLRRMLEERPPHLLPAGFDDWRAFLRAVLVDAVSALDVRERGALAATWGDVNRLDAGHPLRNLPLIGRWLELPSVPQPGSMASIRVATPSRGAVFRMVVSPSRPEAGILEMAGGQSGHFLSPHFRDQQEAWSSGAPAPFMAGETVDSFSLEPAAATPTEK